MAVKQVDRKKNYQFEFSIDAFHYGNWTRFCNHRCNLFNAAPRAVYIDDIDPRRPLWAFFATRNIKVSSRKTLQLVRGAADGGAPETVAH